MEGSAYLILIRSLNSTWKELVGIFSGLAFLSIPVREGTDDFLPVPKGRLKNSMLSHFPRTTQE